MTSGWWWQVLGWCPVSPAPGPGPGSLSSSSYCNPVTTAVTASPLQHSHHAIHHHTVTSCVTASWHLRDSGHTSGSSLFLKQFYKYFSRILFFFLHCERWKFSRLISSIDKQINQFITFSHFFGFPIFKCLYLNVCRWNVLIFQIHKRNYLRFAKSMKHSQ